MSDLKPVPFLDLSAQFLDVASQHKKLLERALEALAS